MCGCGEQGTFACQSASGGLIWRPGGGAPSQHPWGGPWCVCLPSIHGWAGPRWVPAPLGTWIAHPLCPLNQPDVDANKTPYYAVRRRPSPSDAAVRVPGSGFEWDLCLSQSLGYSTSSTLESAARGPGDRRPDVARRVQIRVRAHSFCLVRVLHFLRVRTMNSSGMHYSISWAGW